MKRALITGITGQDGSYLADILLEKGYVVHGLYRRSSSGNLSRVAHILDRVTLHQGDLADPLSVERAIRESEPDELYNEADQDSVGWSHAAPGYSLDITAGAVGRTLETLRRFPGVKFFQPCTAMMFGDAALLLASEGKPQNEKTRFNPQSPYACAKVAAYYLCRHYREQHGMHVCTAIFYNHDSPRRTEEYLLHKICKGAVRMARGEQKEIALGNLDSRVDIGYAREYMAAAWRIMQLDVPDDFVIGTGVATSVGELAEEAFRQVGVSGAIVADPKFWRTGITSYLRADCAKARAAFGFAPQWDVKRLIRLLIEHAREKHG